MQNILVILDKPKHEQIALQRALELTQKTSGGAVDGSKVQLHLVSFVYEPLQWLPFMSESAKLITEQIQNDRSAWMERLKEKYTLPENTRTEVLWHHDIPEWVDEYLDKTPCDLVLKTAQKQFGSGGFGSIDWRLIERSAVPLWIAVSTPWIKRDRIVAALDPALENSLHRDLNQRVLKLGGALAESLDADIEAVACVPAPDVVKDLDAFREGTGALLTAIDELVADSGVSCRKVHFETGKPAAEVNRIVDRNKARLILVGRGVRKGARRFLLGNTAERILGRSNTDVLVVP
ncbi:MULTISPECIES: universal stress protein [Microbulbifer]|uniref:Universal stress protein n=1 Tax=Microbulbifer celer TaxID=435905 RepID=A0ABW3U9H6_9GAMM|nr:MULTISPECIES: universal stress protein [Microbulbifer]UFN57287.1 universal stress protein [Microbulbifer celer]